MGYILNEMESNGDLLTAEALAKLAEKRKEAAEKEPTRFDLILISAGKKERAVIRAVRNLLQIGRLEAVNIVTDLPKCILKDLDKERALELRALFEGLGASVRFESMK